MPVDARKIVSASDREACGGWRSGLDQANGCGHVRLLMDVEWEVELLRFIF